MPRSAVRNCVPLSPYLRDLDMCVIQPTPGPPLVYYNTTELELEKGSLGGNSAVPSNFFSALNIWGRVYQRAKLWSEDESTTVILLQRRTKS